MTDYFHRYRTSIDEVLQRTSFRGPSGEDLSAEDGISAWVALTQEAKNAGGRIIFCGNGASAAMSSHMALDFTKNGGVPALAFNDAAFLTAIANDVSFENVFSLCIEHHARVSDLLVTISSSGNSPNILAALAAAAKLGMKSVTLSGMKPDNKSRGRGTLSVYAPAETYGVVECCHQILLHCWLDRLLNIEPR